MNGDEDCSAIRGNKTSTKDAAASSCQSSADSTDGFGFRTDFSVPQSFRINSRRVYGRVLTIVGLGEGNMTSEPYVLVGATVNIPEARNPDGTGLSTPLLVVAPLKNLGRRDSQPLTDISVGMPIVGTLEALNTARSCSPHQGAA